MRAIDNFHAVIPTPWAGAAGADDWLAETRQLDLSHPRLRITAQKLTQSRQTLAARAAAVQDFVRRLPFSAQPHASLQPASEVLLRGSGDCHSKGVLFAALCRAAGLPARLLFVRIATRFLAGILEERPASMTHAIGQVRVEGGWVSTDGYVVDPLLFARARQLLRESGEDCGWGVVCDARGVWDGRGPCLQQFRAADVEEIYGSFPDVDAFLDAGVREREDWFDSVRYALGACRVNWRVARLRTERVELQTA